MNGDELLCDAGIAEGAVLVVLKQAGAAREWEQRDRNKPAPDLAAINKITEKISVPSAQTAGTESPATAAAEGAAAAASVEESFQGLHVTAPPRVVGEGGEGGEGGAHTAAQTWGQPDPLPGAGVTLPEPDAAAMTQLLEMGFPENRARKALLLHYNSPGAAMEWLLVVTDAEADAALTDEQVRRRLSLFAHSVRVDVVAVCRYHVVAVGRTPVQSQSGMTKA